MLIWTLKLVMSVTVDDTASVSVADVDWPALRGAPSLFHVTVNGPFALAGLQLDAVMLSVSRIEPVFLIYNVCVAVLPGVIAPQSIVVRGTVQALSE